METLKWSQVERYLSVGKPALLPMGGTRDVRIGIDRGGRRMFVRLCMGAGEISPESLFHELKVEKVVVAKSEVLEISTESIEIFREFHKFAGLLTEEFEKEGQTASGAFVEMVKRWGQLIAKGRLLSADEQLGLFGELSVLLSMIDADGNKSILAWTGRSTEKDERHDFRIKNIDIEVKSTSSAARLHYIHGLHQMEPLEGRKLFLISLQFASGGLEAGVALGERVQEIRDLIKMDGKFAAEFEGKLTAAGYFDVDSVHYTARYALAGIPMMIHVNESFPRITRSMIKDFLGADGVARIGANMTYQINVEGMGLPLPEACLVCGLKPMEIN